MHEDFDPAYDKRTVERILAAVGFEAHAIHLLAHGSTSVVWRVQMRQACLVLAV
jgi:hypothetical protein